ncbi:hypothetical protein TNCV_1605821 [Trichonephila clavipes]|nr:hypothetical protein TNCV_1605821 [Trichonephila clavipes]
MAKTVFTDGVGERVCVIAFFKTFKDESRDTCLQKICSLDLALQTFLKLPQRRRGEPCPGSRELERRALDGENLRRAVDGENLRRALNKGGLRLEWKGRKDDERRWRWGIRGM